MAFLLKKYQNIITGSLNGCDILYNCLRHLQYIIRFPTFWILIRSCSLFMIYAPQKPHKSFHRSIKEVWHKPNLLLLFKIHLKVFAKIPILTYIIFAIFEDIFEAMFGSDAVCVHKNPRICHRSLQCVRHPPNLLGSFRVYIKISSETIS